MSLLQRRVNFNTEVAPQLASQVGVTTAWADRPALTKSSRFAYFADRHQLVMVAGEQEEGHVQHAFAYGLGYRQDRKLVLVLPKSHSFATLQRVPWFTDEAKPKVWLHDGQTAWRKPLPSRADTEAEVCKRLKEGRSLAEELAAAATPLHLGSGSAAVHELVEQATADPRLDPSHRRSERAWQCMGQRVLTIQRTKQGLSITAGIHYSDPETAQAKAPVKILLADGGHLSRDQLDELKQHVEEGIRARLEGPPPIHRRDEHWLQAVIRRDPTLVGIEQPALREMPAWRPRDDQPRWGRGFIDLIGMDGHGDIRIVETKLASNPDDLLILQGLDYYIWANAYRQVLIDRLGAPHRARIELHYAIGDAEDGTIKLSPFIRAQAEGLGDDVAWRFQTVSSWYHPRTGAERAQSDAYAPQMLPGPARETHSRVDGVTTCPSAADSGGLASSVARETAW